VRGTVQKLWKHQNPSLWPANSPDLNPVDYRIWAKLQGRVNRSRIRDVAQLKLRFFKEWGHFNLMCRGTLVVFTP